jgi:hypothetical protein
MYKNNYLKYKIKYLQLKSLHGGAGEIEVLSVSDYWKSNGRLGGTMSFRINELKYFIISSEYNLFNRNLMQGYIFNETKKTKLMDLSEVFFPWNKVIFHTIMDAIRDGDKILIKTDDSNKDEFEKALTNTLKPEKA